MTQAEVKAALPGWIKRAIEDKGLTEWPTKSDNFVYTFPTERYGVKQIMIGINPKKGVGTVYPIKGSLVYEWRNSQWILK